MASFSSLSPAPPSPYSWPKGVSMPALLHGVIRKGKKNLRLAYVPAWAPRALHFPWFLTAMRTHKKCLSLIEVGNSFCLGLLNEILLGFQGRWKSHWGEKNYHFFTRKQTVDSPADSCLPFTSRLTTTMFCNILLSFPHKWPMSQTLLSPSIIGALSYRRTSMQDQKKKHQCQKWGRGPLGRREEGKETPGQLVEMPHGMTAAGARRMCWQGCVRFTGVLKPG